MGEVFVTTKKAIYKVFRNKRYVAIGFIFAMFVYLLSVLTHKAEFVGFAIKSELFDFTQKIKLIFGALLSIDTNFISYFSFWVVVLLALIAGINIAMLVYLLRRQAKVRKEAGASIFGVIAGMLGIGCAACGSVILTTIFGLGFTASLISFLPLDGAEFMIIALIVMMGSVYYISRKITNPMVCKPKRLLEIEE